MTKSKLIHDSTRHQSIKLKPAYHKARPGNPLLNSLISQLTTKLILWLTCQLQLTKSNQPIIAVHKALDSSIYIYKV